MAAKEILVKKYVVRLSDDEREQLATLIRKGSSPAQRLANARQGTRPVRRRQAAAVPGSGPTHTERMERHPGRALPQGSRQVLGGNPRPRKTVRNTRGNRHAWRAGCRETCTSGSERGMKKPAPETELTRRFACMVIDRAQAAYASICDVRAVLAGDLVVARCYEARIKPKYRERLVKPICH
jgi:hypothetical protein